MFNIHNNTGKAARDFNIQKVKNKKKCDQFIHPVKNEEYEILLKLCEGELSVPVADRPKVQKSTIIKFWRNREKFRQNKNVLFHDSKKVLCLLFLLFY